MVSQEPVYDLYRYLYGDGIRRTELVGHAGALRPHRCHAGPGAGRPGVQHRRANDTQRPGCKAANWLDQAGNDDHTRPTGSPRNLIPGAAGSNVPLFLTQGLTENNTVADGTGSVPAEPHRSRARLAGPVGSRARRRDRRIGPAEDGPPRVVRRGHPFLQPAPQGRAPTVADPGIAVQTNDGKWRGENRWPPADAAGYTSALNPGSYTDEPRATPPDRAAPRACGPSPRGCRGPPTWPARAGWTSTCRRRFPGRTWSWTSTTSTLPARDR